MACSDGECPTQFFFPTGQRLVGPSVNEIERGAFKYCRCPLEGMARLIGRVVASQELQRRIIQGLNAQRESIDPDGPEVGKPCGLTRGRVRLHGDLGGIGDAPR